MIRAHEDALIRAWADEIYADRRTDLPGLLSYRELIDSIPEVLDEAGRLLDAAADEGEVAESARWLRRHAQVRFQQGCLLDEVARELMILREVLNEFLWREGLSAMDGDLRALRDALRRANALLDGLLVGAVVTYAASLRPRVQTRATDWPPPQRRERDDKL